MKLRLASPDDANRVANLHADSWRRHYRGAYSDAYLDGDVYSDRLALWLERLARPDGKAFTVVAMDQDELLGFAHTIPAHDATYGALLDNLHVTSDRMRRGLGGTLMRETAAVLKRRNISTGLYLWVLEQNLNAQAFYVAQGGECMGREILGPFPGGGKAPALRYYWANPVASFLARGESR
jgi:GNAT superfamily N-acetyltransferase